MRHADADDDAAQPLSHYVGTSLDRYFESLNDSAPPTDLYHMVLEQVERPLLERVLDYNRGNQSKAAAMLGINRGTLRKKLRNYNLD
ncbi:helix-turn-helix domain-containing protein [Salinisphaera sp.]|uniref:helix-turn-helix domain-containing protein n=1 Tax=Salinisphaera sp. TaxID=1914330 RepID=UPI002D78BF29|nr:helix-turn-helix domain-containing protein [Salinisphaera sp.]